MDTKIILGNRTIYKIPYNNETKYHYIQTIVKNKNKIELDIDNPKQYTWVKYLFDIEFNQKKCKSYLKKILSCSSTNLCHFPKPFNVFENYKMIYWLYSNFAMHKILIIVKKIIIKLINNIEHLNNPCHMNDYYYCNLIIKKFEISFTMSKYCPKKMNYSFFIDIDNQTQYIHTDYIERLLLIPYNVPIFDCIKTFNNVTFNLFDIEQISGTIISDGFFYDIKKSWSNFIIIHSNTYKFSNDAFDFVTIPMKTGCIYYLIDYDICIFVFDTNLSYKSPFFFRDKKLYVSIKYLVSLYNFNNILNNNICIYENTILKINRTHNKSMLCDVVKAIDMSCFGNLTKKKMIYKFIQVYLACYNETNN